MEQEEGGPGNGLGPAPMAENIQVQHVHVEGTWVDSTVCHRAVHRPVCSLLDRLHWGADHQQEETHVDDMGAGEPGIMVGLGVVGPGLPRGAGFLCTMGKFVGPRCGQELDDEALQ
jgi:hypothetical protein